MQEWVMGLEPSTPRRSLCWSLAIAAVVVAFLAYIVFATQAGLSWDDADYVESALNWARLIQEGSRPINSGGRPPLLTLWLLPWALLFGPDHPLPLLYPGTVVPFACALAGVALACSWLGRSRVAPYALACLSAAPLALAYGGKVMVETFLGLWVLLALAAAARTLEKPTIRIALALGVFIGLALLTKLSAAVFLSCPALYFLVRWLIANRPAKQKGIVLATAVAGLVATAGPYYARRYRIVLAHAAYASHFDELAMLNPDTSPRVNRLVTGPLEVFGWPLLATAVLVGGHFWFRGKSAPSTEPAFRHYAWMTGLSIAFT